MLKKLRLFIVPILLLLFTYYFVAKDYHISGDCMEPAIKDGKVYFVNHLYYHVYPYKVGDIIIFRHEDKIWISRIMALENQEIKIEDKTISLDHKVYTDSIERNWTDWKYGTYGISDALKILRGMFMYYQITCQLISS